MKQSDANTDLKQAVGVRAAGYVQPGQIVGLGTGSTAAFFIQELGRRQAMDGLRITCVATSFSSSVLARQSGLVVLPLESFDHIDISVDGADEIDPGLNLIKGGGAAHTREKLVHAMSSRFIVIADDSKRSSRLGEKFRVPVECIPSSVNFVQRRLLEMGAQCELRMARTGKDGPVVTDNGNLVVDVTIAIPDPLAMETELNSIPGVLENGIFARNRPHLALIAGASGLEEIPLRA